MTKYPGSFILNEIGTRSEMAQSWGVSTRTIYRWLAKARKEEGIKNKTSKYPGAKRIANFKGTRKELADKYGVSERTAYRWIQKAQEQGQDVTRRKATQYPGTGADLNGKLKDVAENYNVSERTIQRWRKRQQQEKDKTEEEQELGFDEDIEIPAETPAEEPVLEETPEDQEFGFDEEIEEFKKDLSEETFESLKNISDILQSEPDLLVEGSIFNDLTKLEKLQYLDAYIQYQYDLDEHQFYNEAEHKMDFSPDFVSTVNIWGEEFETWAQKQFDYSMFEV